MSVLLKAILEPSNMLFWLSALSLVLMGLAPLKRVARRVFLTCFALLLVIALTPISRWALQPFEYAFAYHEPVPGQRIDAIIHLSGAERQSLDWDGFAPPLNHHAGRYFEVARLARLYPNAQIIFTGGTPKKGRSDVDIAKRQYAAMGIAERAVFLTGARSTADNAKDVAAYFASVGQPERSILVTSASHMPRSIGSFRKAGLNPIAGPAAYMVYPCDSGLRCWLPAPLANLDRFDRAVYEAAGLILYRLRGDSSRLWPSSDQR